jgi:hypothetical protein
MGFLEKVYLGNPLQNLLIALCMMVVAFAVLKIIHRVVISRISIFQRFQEEGIEFAYPTITVYVQNHFEGEK